MFDHMLRAVRDEFFELEAAIFQRHPPKQCVVKQDPKLHNPRLNLADYVSSQAEPPPAVHRSHLEFPWGMLLNGDIGDCGEAMAIHGIEAFHLNAGTPVPPFADGDAERAYSDIMGYDRRQTQPDGSNPTDQGTDNDKLVAYWKDPGILCAADGSRHKIAHSLYVDPHDERLSRIAIWEFVALFRAAGLPLTAQGTINWKLQDPSLSGDNAVGSWGYHDYLYLSYDRKRLRDVTWGQEGLVDWQWDSAYAVQGLVVATQEMLNLRGVSPAGVNWDRLAADLQKL
jgi:hypothetical protein